MAAPDSYYERNTMMLMMMGCIIIVVDQGCISMHPKACCKLAIYPYTLIFGTRWINWNRKWINSNLFGIDIRVFKYSWSHSGVWARASNAL